MPFISGSFRGPDCHSRWLKKARSRQILLQAGGTGSDLITSATPTAAVISTGSGAVSLLAAHSLSLAAAVTTAGAGTLDLEATAGSVTIADNSALTTAGGNIRILAHVDLAVTGLNAGAGNVTLTAATGSVTDGGDTLKDIVAAGLRILAATGIGSGNALDTTVATLAAAAGSGGIAVTDDDDVTVDTVAIVSVSRVTPAAGVTTVGDGAATSDLVTTSGGPIALTSLAGTITLNDGVNADGTALKSDTGAITVSAHVNVLQNANLTTGGAGTVGVTASTGSITMADLTTTTSATGSITYQAATDILLSLLTSTSGALTVTATGGKIADNTALENANLVTTGQTTLTAKTGIGAAGAADIDTTIATLAATNTTSGDIFIQETNALTINGTGVQTQGGNGNINLDVVTGALLVSSAISANGSGTVTVNVDAGTATLNANVSSATGAIVLNANGSLLQNANITTGGAATIQLTAVTGAITMADLTTTTSATGAITLNAATDIALSLITSTSGDLTLTAATGGTTGAITDNTALENANLVTTGQTTLSAKTGIGASGAADLDTTINLLQATNSTSGDIYLQETNALTVNGTGVRTLAGNGNINLDVVAGALLVSSVVTANGSGTVTLAADTGTMTLNAVVSSTTGALVLSADVIAQNANVTTGGAGTVQLTTDVGSITMQDLTTTTSATGSITYQAATDILLSLLTSTSGALTVTATGGKIADNTALENANLITTGQTTLTAKTGIGGAAGPADIDTTINLLQATNTASGDIYIDETNALTINNGGVQTQGGNGNINVEVVTGALLVSSVVSANGSGTVTLLADAGTATVNANVSSATGALVLTGTAVAQNANLTTGGAGSAAVTATTGAITMADGTTTTAGTGGASLTAATTIALSVVNTGTTGPIALTASGGGITDNTAAETANLIGGAATIRAAGPVGTPASDLNTQLTSLDAALSAAGTLTINQVGALTVTNATTTNGAIGVTASGTLIVTSMSTAGTGAIALTTTAGDVLAGSITAAGQVITVTAAGRLNPVTGAPAPELSAATLTLKAGTGIGSTAQLVVSAPVLSADTATGDINLRNLLASAVTVTSLTTGAPGPGQITYSGAGGPLTLQNAATKNGNINVSVDQGNITATTVAAGGTGDVNFAVQGNGQVLYTTVTAGGGDIGVATGGAVVLNQPVLATNGSNLLLTGNITLATDVTVTTGGGAVTFTGTLDGAHALTINAGAGAVEFDSAVGGTTPLTSLTVTTTGAARADAGLQVAGAISFTSGSLELAGGAGSVASTTGGSFTAAPATDVGATAIGAVPAGAYNYVLDPATLNALAAGFSVLQLGLAGGTGRTDLGDATFLSPTVVLASGPGGMINVLSGRTVTATGTNPLTLTAGTGTGVLTVQSGAQITAGSGTVTLTGDQVSLAGSPGAISGTGVLVLQPASTTRDIVVGRSGTAAQFDLTLAELAVPATTFAVLDIGRTDGADSLTVYATSFPTPVSFRAPVGAGQVTIAETVTTSHAGGNLTATAGADVLVQADVRALVSGNLTLTADADLNHAGTVRVAQTTVNTLFTASGAIALLGDSVLLGTAGTRAELIAPAGSISLTVDRTGAGTGSLVLGSADTQVKASGTLTVTGGTGPAPVTPYTQVTLHGLVIAVGGITVTSSSGITGSNLALHGPAGVTFTTAGDLTLLSGVVDSQGGPVTLTADSDHNGTGTLAVAAGVNVLVAAGTNAVLSGEQVNIGSAFGYAHVVTGGDLTILADLNFDGVGGLALANASTLLAAAGSLTVGRSGFGAGTPAGIILADASLLALNATVYSQVDVTLTGAIYTIAQNLTILAERSISLTGGRLVAQGQALSLGADADANGTGDLTAAGGTQLTVPAGTLSLSGDHLDTSGAVLQDLHVSLTPVAVP